MTQTRLLAVLIAILESLNIIFVTFNAFGILRDPGVTQGELIVSASHSMALLVTATFLWKGRRIGWSLTAWLLALTMAFSLLHALFGYSENVGPDGLTLLVYGALLHLQTNVEVQEYCQVPVDASGRRKAARWVLAAKLGMYGGILLVTSDLAGWSIAIPILLLLVLVREWIWPRLQNSRPTRAHRSWRSRGED